MSGILDLYAAQAGPSGPPLVSIPSTPGERFGAEYDAATAPDRWFNLNGARRDFYQRVIDEHHAETGTTLVNPYGAMTAGEMSRLGNEPAVIAERKNKLIEENRALREMKPDALNAEGADTFIGLQGDAAQQRAAELVGTGSGLAGFAGGMLAPTPENILGAMLPPGRAIFGATTMARSFLGGLVREGAYQAGAMGALTAATEGLDVLARRETGTAPGAGEVATNILGSALGGAVLGGAFHAVHAGPKALWEHWNRLPEDVRAKAPLEVKDSFNLLEREALYGSTNRLGLPWDLHERYQGRANDAVLRGTPPNFEDLANAGDTPMTALTTILRQTPDRINVEGLGRTLGRIASLPDSEIEAFGRQLKPATFAPLDRIDGELAKLDERVKAIHDEADQIGLADVADIDTAARLQDIENRLQAKGLRAAVRDDLERERGMIQQSIDPQGQLTAELGRTRKDFFPEHSAALKQIEEERAGLMRERESAQSVATREIAAIRQRLDSLTVGRQFADEAPADVLGREFGTQPQDMAGALETADFNRQIRTVRETMPMGSVVSRETTPRTEAPLTPQAQAVLDGETQRILGANNELGGFRKALIRELDVADREQKDAAAALGCVNNGGGIP